MTTMICKGKEQEMENHIRRVTLMTAIAAALAISSFVAPAQAQTEIKIGFINSYSGFLAQPGDEMDKGVMLYKQEHDKDLPPGVTVTLLKRDDTSTPETAKRLAQELITRDHVQLLFGVVASPNAAAPCTKAVLAETVFKAVLRQVFG